MDQQFADYEAQIRSLRNSLAEREKSLRQAREAADASNYVIQVAKETIALRNQEIELRNNRIAELEREVNHCQQHHPAPPTPSKLRGSDAAISRFNVDARRSPKSPTTTNSSAAVSPFLSGRQFAVTLSPKQSTEESPTALPRKPDRPKFFTVSSVAPPSSAEGSPVLRPETRSHASPSAIYSPLTIETLSAALASAAGTSKAPTEASEGYHIRKPSDEVVKTAKSKSASTSPAHKPQTASRRALQSPASSPNLCLSKDYTPSRMPPLPSIMSGGLGIFDVSNSEMQDQKLRKKRGGLGDIFRRKDQGADSLVRDS